MGEVAEALRLTLSKLLGRPVRFYSKHKTNQIACFLHTLKNLHQERCVKVVDNQNNTLATLEELEGRYCKLWAVLRVGGLKENDDKTYSFSLTAYELNIQDVTENDECYQELLEPTILFADKE